MKNKKNTYKKGFTLLEMVLVIGLVTILAAIVLIAINPTGQVGQARDATRIANLSDIQKAIDQYSIKNEGTYPSGISSIYQDICPIGVIINCVDLSVLVPNYISKIPLDPSGGNYQIANNRNNGIISLFAPAAESGEDISVNPIILPWAEGGDNIYTISESGVNYRVHEFTTPGSTTLNVTRGGYVEYLVVGGGGGAGTFPGSYPYPGGGGQVVTGNTIVSGKSYPVVVGAGGNYIDAGPGGNGLSSSIFSINANPGLAGAVSDAISGNSGSGFSGGNRQGCGTGGGAGAGGPGGNAVPNCGSNGRGGAGGIGIQSSITGTSLGYGGGGAGVSWNQGSGSAIDGGGMVGLGINHVSIPAISPTRGGGGGSWQNGGNGTIIVRYEVEI